jgi:hypothetical protein
MQIQRMQIQRMQIRRRRILLLGLEATEAREARVRQALV